jgi:hypothetical protein
LTAQQIDQLIEDYLDDLFGRLQLLPNLLTFSLFLDRDDKVFSDFIVDVGFKQSETNLAQRRIDMLLRQHAFAAQVLQRPF